MTAALHAAELGASVALIEADRLGGVCTDDGCTPTRVLAHAARLVREAAQYPDYGLSAARPTLDFARLIAQTQVTVYRIHEKKQLAAHLTSTGVRVMELAGAAHFVDPHTVALGSGGTVRAERFVISVGGHARRLDIPGSELALTHSDVWRLTSLPARLAIVGSAATGSQLASIFAAFGSQVTLLDLAPRILPAEDVLVSSTMGHAFANRGIEVATGIDGIRRLVRDGPSLRLDYAVAGEERRVAVDAAIMAVGWQGNTAALGLEMAGVATERDYVRVGPDLRTSADHVWAAGDVTGGLMLVQTATSEARLAAENAVRGGGRRVDHRIVPHGGFTDPEYASVGSTLGVTVVVGYDELDRAVIDGRTEGFAKLVVTPDGLIAGASVVGEQAVEVAQVVASAMAASMRVEQVAELELAYPTYAAILGLAARRLVQRDQARSSARWETVAATRPAEWEWRERNA